MADKKPDPQNRPSTQPARSASTPAPSTTPQAAPAAPARTAARPGRRAAAGDRAGSGIRRVDATRDASEDRNVATGGYVEVTVPSDYGTLEGEQPDGTRKTFKPGERATLPLSQAKALGIVDEDGEEADLAVTRAARTQSYGQRNEGRPLTPEEEGKGAPKSDEATHEEVGKSPAQ